MPKRIESEPAEVSKSDKPITLEDLMKAMDKLAEIYGLSKEEVKKLKEKHNLPPTSKEEK